MEPTSRRRDWHRRLLLALLLVSLGAIGAGAISMATFTGSGTSGGSWTTGTIVLTASPATAFNVTAVLPGDSGSQTVAIQNAGTAALQYDLTSSSTNTDGKGLATQLTLTITTGTCGSSGGTQLYSGTLGAAAFGTLPGGRTLSAGTSESLCFAWSLPSSTSNAYQGATTTTTFTFNAQQ